MSLNNNIENLFKEKFNSWSVKPDKSVWTGINRSLLFKRLLKFDPLRFNLWYAFSILIIGGFVLWNQISSDTDNIGLINISEIDVNNERVIPQLLDNDLNIVNNNVENEKLNDNDNNHDVIIDKIEENFELSKVDYTSSNIYNTHSELNNEGNQNSKLADPVADFHASDYQSCEPASIYFTNSSENCSDCMWDFGNGQTSSDQNPIVVYKTAGNYTVTLKCNSGSLSSSIKKIITVLPKPNAAFMLKTPNNLFVGENIEFVFTGSKTNDNIWNFGDGNSAKGLNPDNIYENPGKFRVNLISFQAECTDTFFSDLVIKDEKYKISAPTAFTPDISGPSGGYWKSESKPNSIFYPVLNYQTTDFKLKIFDKFGNLIFFSNNPDIGWDGWYNGKPASSNVYIWECEVKFIDGEKFLKKGNITLLHSNY
jgi:gliding motility-associated-like protein